MAQTRLHRLAAGLLLAAILTSGGCGVLSGYHLQFRAASATPQPCHSLAGTWEGYWESSETGHKGNLRAIITMTGPNRAEARFHARFFKLFTAQYSVPLVVQSCGDHLVFCGQRELPLFGGEYRTNGYATDCCFVANYCCPGVDSGKFVMRRTGCCYHCGCDTANGSATDIDDDGLLPDAPTPAPSPSDLKP